MEVWVKKVKKGYVVEMRGSFFFKGEWMTKLAKGQVKAMKLYEFPDEAGQKKEKGKSEKVEPETIRVTPEEMEF